MRKADHVHKLRRHKYHSSDLKVYFCTLPDCTFKVEVALALGKRSICNRCGDEFIMDELSLRLAKPHCKKCSRKRTVSEDGVVSYVTPDRVIADVADKKIADMKTRLSLVTSKDEGEI